MLRSRRAPLVTHLSSAVVQVRSHRGRSVAAYRPARLESVAGELADRARQRARQPVGIHDEVGDCAPGRLAGPDATAHRQGCLRGVTGEQVGDAGAAVDQEPSSRREGRLDQRGVLRLVGHQHPVMGTVVPAERRDPVDHAVQDAHLAGGGGRRQLRRPLLERVGSSSDPAGQRGDRARGDGHLQHREGDAVQLHEHDARDVCVFELHGMTTSGCDQPSHERLGGAGAAEPAGHRPDEAEHHRDEERAPEVVDRHVREKTSRDADDQRLAGEGEDEDADPAELDRSGHHGGLHHQHHHAEHDREPDRPPRKLHVEPRDDRVAQHHAHRDDREPGQRRQDMHVPGWRERALPRASATTSDRLAATWPPPRGSVTDMVGSLPCRGGPCDGGPGAPLRVWRAPAPGSLTPFE